jgi:biopolymer transport protein ExbD
MAKEQEKLSAAQRSKIRRLSAPRELAPDEEGGELNIVPFLDIIMNVLMFVLATVSVTFTATIDSTPPAPSGGAAARAAAQETLNLTILVVPDGRAAQGEEPRRQPDLRQRKAERVRAEAEGLVGRVRQRAAGRLQRQPEHPLPVDHRSARRGPLGAQRGPALS